MINLNPTNNSDSHNKMTTPQDELCCGYCKQDIQLPALCAIVYCTECTPKHNIWRSKCYDKFETYQDKKFKERKSSMRAKCGTPWHNNANSSSQSRLTFI